MPDTSGKKSCGIFQSKGGEFARMRLLWTIGQFVFFFYVIVIIDLMRANYLSAPRTPPPRTSPGFHIGNERWVHHP